jgi:4-hydroxy-3-methylbut-2-enyl diphosphate reductase
MPSGEIMVKVDIDPGAGFCFGVEDVIRTAETSLRKGEVLYALGDLVHNGEEMKRLKAQGMKTISHERLPEVRSGKVLFRAHGEPPSTYRIAGEQNIEIIDGTCPIVKKLQKKIRDTYREMDPEIEQLVIFGNPDHPETIGLLGQVDGNATVVRNAEEVGLVDRNKRVHLFSQTTMDPDRFAEVESLLRVHAGNVNAGFRSSCTICGQMKRRKPKLREFALSHDVILFVSGRNSSNGKMLFEFCRSVNPGSHWISGPDEIETSWLENAGNVGISGATSTSFAQLESVRNRVEKLTST